LANTTIGLTQTKAKVYLGTGDDIFTVSNSGATVYGNTGRDEVIISSGVTGVVLDQNIDQVIFTGSSGNYTFKQTGNIIKKNHRKNKATSDNGVVSGTYREQSIAANRDADRSVVSGGVIGIQ